MSFMSKAQWTQQLSGTNHDLNSIYFIDALKGWAVGDSGVIIKTTDGGTNWTSQSSGVTDGLRSVHFENNTHGWASTGGGSILVSDGNNWTLQYSGASSWLESLFFTDINNGWASGGAFAGHTRMVKTTNGGLVWDTLSTLNPSYSGNSLFFINSSIGWKTNWNLTISKTTDGGNTWTPQNKSQNKGDINALHSVFFVDANNGCAVGDSGIVYTTINGGANWNLQNSGTYNYLRSVCFINSNDGYAVGQNGTILKTSNGGINWIIQNSNTIENLRSVFFTDINTGYVVGDNGTVLKISNANGVENTSYDNSLINIYPNPVIDKINITVQKKQLYKTISFSIYNIQGQLLLQQSILQDKTEFDINGFAKGVYILKLNIDDKTEMTRFVKE